MALHLPRRVVEQEEGRQGAWWWVFHGRMWTMLGCLDILKWIHGTAIPMNHLSVLNIFKAVFLACFQKKKLILHPPSPSPYSINNWVGYTHSVKWKYVCALFFGYTSFSRGGKITGLNQDPIVLYTAESLKILTPVLKNVSLFVPELTSVWKGWFVT